MADRDWGKYKIISKNKGAAVVLEDVRKILETPEKSSIIFRAKQLMKIIKDNGLDFE